MFCSGCGHVIPDGQGVCQQCGRPIAPPVPPVPGLQFEVENYAGKIRTLGLVWFIYGGLSLAAGFFGMAFARVFMGRHFGNFHGGPFFPEFFAPAIIHFGWMITLLRSAMAFSAGWGLMERTRWGRTVAIIVAFLSLFHPLVGTALGIWTLVTLMGYRNTALYEQLPQQ